MANLNKLRCLKIEDIQNVLKYIFNGSKRPRFIQLNPKPEKVVLFKLCDVFTTADSLLSANNLTSIIEKSIARPTEFPTINASQIEPNPKQIINNIESEEKSLLFDDSASMIRNISKKTTQTMIGKLNAIHDKNEISNLELLKKLNLSKVFINENMNLDEILTSIFFQIDELNFDLGLITVENLKLITKHDLNYMFMLSCAAKSDLEFEKSMFKTFLKPNKESQYFLLALDCEMMECKDGKQIGRVTLLDHAGNTVFDTYVRPESAVIDYLEEYSGLNESNTKDGMSLEELNCHLLDLVGTNTYILGHGLDNDFQVLNFCVQKIIDTSYLYLSSSGHKQKLAHLSKNTLKTNIQSGPHSSREDSLACLRLLSLAISRELKYKSKALPSVNLETNIKRIKDLPSHEVIEKLIVAEISYTQLIDFNPRNNTFYIFLYNKGGKPHLAFKQTNDIE